MGIISGIRSHFTASRSAPTRLRVLGGGVGAVIAGVLVAITAVTGPYNPVLGGVGFEIDPWTTALGVLPAAISGWVLAPRAALRRWSALGLTTVFMSGLTVLLAIVEVLAGVAVWLVLSIGTANADERLFTLVFGAGYALAFLWPLLTVCLLPVAALWALVTYGAGRRRRD